MGFMDKAKKMAQQAQEKGYVDKAKQMAEQAQSKLDEAQTKFNEGQKQGSAPSGPVQEYDKHGRPVGTPAGPSPADEGVPAAAPTESAPEPAAQAEPDTPAAPVAPPTPPSPPTAGPSGDLGPAPAGADADEYAPPKLSSGDPLG
jgi:hypothetical protein